jgi:hypothetical protein
VASLLPCIAHAAEWQYSVPMAGAQEQRAYLWIPPHAKRVRGLVVGLQNMLEKPMLQDPIIRKSVAKAGLAIVWISPGDEIPAHPALSLKFDPPQTAVAALHQALDDLARESGYSEIAWAPLLPVGHSAATPFVWGMPDADTGRVFADLPYKGWYPPHAPQDVPILHVSSEWAEWGASWGETEAKDTASTAKLRGESDHCLLGEFTDIGAGHFDWNPAAAKVIGLFIEKAARYRIPEDEPKDGPVALIPVARGSGWLIDPATLGTPACRPVPYADWKGDPAKALWYFDAEMAKAVNDDMAAELRKKPQAIDFASDGIPCPLDKNGFAEPRIVWQPDGVTFKVSATYLDKSPTTNLFSGAALEHPPAPIQFRVASGALKQVGPDTFQVWLDRGGVQRQGPPWEPWIMAYSPGDDTYRSADRPAHAWVNIRNTAGEEQAIDFPKIPDQAEGTRTVTLSARASSGLPVQYYVVSGPAEIDGDTLTLTTIPPRSRYPVRVLVAAYQWGRAIDPKVQSAGPVVQEFFITRRQTTTNHRAGG